MDTIKLTGVRTHNLKNIDVSFPLYKLTAVSGVSGSGKSSLVFHTLHAQSYRRYVDSLSSYARQYLKSFPKPRVETTFNLPPSIAVKQSRGGAGYRSTVGSLTEIDDLLRVIFSTLAKPHCPNGHGVVEEVTLDSMVSHCLKTYLNTEVTIVAPLSKLMQGLSEGCEDDPATAAVMLLSMLAEQGFSRLMDGSCKVLALKDCTAQMLLSDGDERKAAKQSKSTQPSANTHKQALMHCRYSVVIDRLYMSKEDSDLVREALERAAKLGKGVVSVVSGKKAGSMRLGGNCMHCSYSAKPLKDHMLQANHPLGACEECQGFGRAMVWDWDKILLTGKDARASLRKDVLPLFAIKGGDKAYERLKQGVKEKGISLDKPFSEYTKAERAWIQWGDWQPCESANMARYTGTQLARAGQSFGGIIEYMVSLNEKRGAYLRIHLARFRRYITCPVCLGGRLRKEVMDYVFADLTFPMIQKLSVVALQKWLEKHVPMSKAPNVLHDALKEVHERLGYLKDMGLEYMSMYRASSTLSGGELQRINMARCLGSALSQSLYCLDEPTAGLHPLDASRLLKVMQRLRDQGNTVVVVEHDPQTLLGCDHLLHIGPLAGHKGGHLEYAGLPGKFLSAKARQFPSLDKVGQKASKVMLSLKGVKTHNLKDVDIDIPLGAITGVCGVSGSGKTTLIRHSLYPAVCGFLGVTQKHKDMVDGADYESIGPAVMQNHISDVALVSQDALGRSSRATIVTYLGISKPLRDLFAATEDAKRLQFQATIFSFNTPGGRCETCLGVGTVVEDLSFLGEITVQCPTCKGERFAPEVLGVKYRGKSISEVLSLTVDEAYTFFADIPSMASVLSQVKDLGLGYITLGQSTASFSGGEAQRLKILRLLVQQSGSSKPQLLIFDEPTGGLSEDDVEYLWRKLTKLQQAGHTIIIIEHHLALLRSVDWLIEVGPGAGEEGGEIIFQGAPQKLKAKSYPRSSMSSYLHSVS